MGNVIQFNTAKKEIAKIKKAHLIIKKTTKKRQDRILKSLRWRNKRAKQLRPDKPSIDTHKLVKSLDKNDG